MTKKVLEIVSQNRERTFAVGRALADFLGAGDVVALTGDLGSGKTVFAQGACAGLDVRDCVTSPTYTLIQEYSGRLPVFHIDFYRLETVREIEDLDLAGCLQSGVGKSDCLPEGFGGQLIFGKNPGQNQEVVLNFYAG